MPYPPEEMKCEPWARNPLIREAQAPPFLKLQGIGDSP